MPPLRDLTGLVFTNLKVIRRSANNAQHKPQWVCLCSCGKEHIATAHHLTSGHTTSCGCRKAELNKTRNLTHGQARRKYGSPTKIYFIWSSMRMRCNNPDHKSYKNYGARGIKVCPEWDLFEQFYMDMGDAPFVGAEIDRKDNDKGYSKDNCRWTTAKVNNNNRRSNLKIHFNGEILSGQEISDRTGIRYNKVLSLYHKGHYFT